MSDPRLDAIATLVCDLLEIGPGSRPLLAAPPAGEACVLAIARAAWRRGADPAVAIEPPGARARVEAEGDEQQRAWRDGALAELALASDSLVEVHAHPDGPPALPELPQRRLALSLPTELGAQAAELGTQQLERTLYEAALGTAGDPLAEARALDERGAALATALAAAERAVLRLAGEPERDLSGGTVEHVRCADRLPGGWLLWRRGEERLALGLHTPLGAALAWLSGAEAVVLAPGALEIDGRAA